MTKSNKPEKIAENGIISLGNQTFVIREEFARRLFIALIVELAKYVHNVRLAKTKIAYGIPSALGVFRTSENAIV
jgi:hypothetical protein